MTWFRVFTAALAALIVFSVGLTLLAMLASWQLRADDSEPEIVTVTTLDRPPP